MKNIGNQYARKHGLWKTPEWQAWSQMRRRCYGVNHISYPRYGARGITVCERWRGPDTFPTFLADVGPRPSSRHSLDRIDNSRGYEPGNVRWATKAEQAKNRRDTHLITFRGETLCVKDWAARLGIGNTVLHERLKAGWSEEATLTTPLEAHNLTLTHREKTLTFAQWSQELGLPVRTIKSRLRIGWSVARALDTPRRG